MLPHLMDEHSGAGSGGCDGRARACVTAECKAPAVGRRDRDAECVRAVHHRETLQPREIKPCLDLLHHLSRSTLSVLCKPSQKPFMTQ